MSGRVRTLARSTSRLLPIVTRHRLDRLASRVEALRTVVREAEAEDGVYTRELLRKVLEAGDRLSREEFEHLAAYASFVRPTRTDGDE